MVLVLLVYKYIFVNENLITVIFFVVGKKKNKIIVGEYKLVLNRRTTNNLFVL